MSALLRPNMIAMIEPESVTVNLIDEHFTQEDAQTDSNSKITSQGTGIGGSLEVPRPTCLGVRLGEYKWGHGV